MQMRRIRTLFISIALTGSASGIGLAGIAGPPVAPAAKPVTPALLTVDKERDVTTTALAEAVWNFGRREVRPEDRIEHVFTLRNATKAPLVLDSLLTSCHCTTADIVRPSAAKGEDLPLELAPGKSVKVRVSIDIDQAHAVDFRKMVWIYVRGRDDAAFTLTVAGTLTAGGDAATGAAN